MQVSAFYEIKVTMNFTKNFPPCFCATFQDESAIIDIENVCCINGKLPSRQLKLILAWTVLHKDELMQNWELSRDNKPLNKISPLV